MYYILDEQAPYPASRVCSGLITTIWEKALPAGFYPMAEQLATEASDEELLELISTGADEAFTEIVRRHTEKFYSIAYRVLADRNEAEDTVQEAFLMLWETPHKWDSHKNAKFTTWFYRVVTNLSLDKKKKRRPQEITEHTDLRDSNPDPEALALSAQKKDRLEAMIDALPLAQQTALNLTFYEGLTNREAARVMDISIKAFESLLVRAKHTLRTKIKNSLKEEVA